MIDCKQLDDSTDEGRKHKGQRLALTGQVNKSVRQSQSPSGGVEPSNTEYHGHISSDIPFTFNTHIREEVLS